MEQRKRNTAILLIGVGLFLLFGSTIGYFTVTAILVLVLAVIKIRSSENRIGYLLLGVAVILLLNDHFVAMMAVLFILIGIYYFHNQQSPEQTGFNKRQSMLESINWNDKQWELTDMSIHSLIGEIRMDFSMAVMEQKETTVILQGVIGDVDIVIPEDMGVSLQSSVWIGQLDLGDEKEAGFMNKTVWQSPNYEECEYKIKLNINYLVGDIKINLL